jgi:polysaccharide biosynthesis protein PslH
MRLLVISPRAPRLDGKGDALRAAALIRALSERHEVEVFVPDASTLRRILSGFSDVLAGRPAQVGFSMPRGAWARAAEAAAQADIAIAITVRAIRGPLSVPLIVDHVDALALNWSRRAKGPESLPVRTVSRLEARRLHAWEARAASWAAGQISVSERDVASLPGSPPVHVIPHGVMFTVPADRPRDIDVVFTGNMRYPPNKQAALWLDREIVPALRNRRLSARVVVAGRGANRLPLANVELMSDVSSIPNILARSRVAIVPLTGLGTGVPNKVLEAAACGAALVVTAWVHERIPLPARVADTVEDLAAQTAGLLADEPARATLALQALTAAGRYDIKQIAHRLEQVLAEAATANVGAKVAR